jgi:hypothetical protein
MHALGLEVIRPHHPMAKESLLLIRRASRTHRLPTSGPLPRSLAACAAVTPRSVTSLTAAECGSTATLSCFFRH